MIEPSLLRHEPPVSHSSASSLREQALSHFFVWELISSMWRAGRHDIEVLKGEIDRSGYDVVIEADGVVRHIQLKSSFVGSKVREISVNAKLLAKPAGCVIWLEVDLHTLALKRYLWFGAGPGSGLPDIGSRVSHHSRANSAGYKPERPMHRLLSKSSFVAVSGANELIVRLFG